MPPQAPNQYAFDYSSQSVEAYKRIAKAVEATVGRKLAAKCLMQLIYRYEKPDRGLQWTYEQLAEELFCHRNTVIRLVHGLEEYELIRTVETRTPDGGDGFNEYRLNWQGIDRANTRRVEREFGAIVRRTGLQAATPGLHSATLGLQPATALKEESYVCLTNTPVPEPETGPKTADGFRLGEEQAADGLLFDPAAELVGGDPRMGRVARDELRKSLFVDVPLLVEAAERLLAPRPCSQLTGFGHALFKGLQVEHLRSRGLIEWHLEQLSAPEVFAGPTEADLLLTLSAGEYAARFPAAELKRNRVALFVSTVSRAEWRKVLDCLDVVRSRLDRTDKFWLAAEVSLSNGG